MPHAPESSTTDEIDVHRVEYFRAVADYAEMIARGADLKAVCERAIYLQSSVLALLVPTLSSSFATLSSIDMAELAQRLVDDRRSVRLILRQLVARNYLMRDVLHSVAQYHDQHIARFWAARLAA